MALVELMNVLEAAAYLSFILGALFAVYQLRIMGRDRQTEFAMRVAEYVSSREFQEPLCKLWETSAQDAERLEEEVTYVGLSMIADYFDALTDLVERRLLREDLVAEQYNYPVLWRKIEPWVLRLREETPQIYSGFEGMAMREASRIR